MKKHLSLKAICIVIIFIFLLIIITVYIFKQKSRPHILEMYTWGLRSSTAAFIRTSNDMRVLVNGGSNSEVVRHMSKIMPFSSRRIDMVIATDLQKKNISGLVDVLERYSVNTLILPAITLTDLDLASSTDSSYDELLKIVRKKKISLRAVTRGEDIVFDNENSVICTMSILFPVYSQDFSYSKTSAPEIVFKLTFGVNNIVWLGQVTKKIQKFFILQNQSIEPVDVLILSQSATLSTVSGELLELLKPAYIIHSHALGRSVSVPLLSSDKIFNTKEKTIKIVSDGEELHINSVE